MMDKERRKIEVNDRRFREEGPDMNGAGEAAMAPAPEEATAAGGSAQADTQQGAVQEDWQARAAEYLELAQRREADLRNFRNRVQKDLEDARRYAIEALLEDLFPALDGLSQAVDGFKDTPPGENALLDGIRGTIRVLDKALAKHGIQAIKETGVPFDGNLHQPLKVEESGDVTEETVVEVYVEGYRLGDAVLKPAMVKVVKPV